MSFSKINNIIARYLKNGGFKAFRHILLLFILVVLTLGMVYNSNNGYNRYEYSLFYEWLSYFLIISCVIYFNLKVLVPRFLLKGRLTNYVSLIILCTIVALFLIVLMQNLLFKVSIDGNQGKPLLNIIGNIISIGLIVVSTSIYALFRGWAEYNQQINELEISTAEAELQQLKSQINPHFIFNTINNANIKAEKDPKQAFSIITKLKGLLSYQLTDTKHDKVYLKDDILFLSDYLELEKTRRSRFNYTLKTNEEIYNLKVSPLLFIPFVENAVKHSLTTKGESNINIAFELQQGHLYFHCENTKPTIPTKRKSGGLGLKNIRRRLSLLYGEAYTLNIIESKENYIVNLYLKI